MDITSIVIMTTVTLNKRRSTVQQENGERLAGKDAIETLLISADESDIPASSNLCTGVATRSQHVLRLQCVERNTSYGRTIKFGVLK